MKTFIIPHTEMHEFIQFFFEGAFFILLKDLPRATAVAAVKRRHQLSAAVPLHFNAKCGVRIFIRLVGEPDILLHILINKGRIRLPQILSIKRIQDGFKYVLTQLHLERRQLEYVI